MDVVAPMTFLYSFLHSPLSPTSFGRSPPLSLSYPPTFLSVLFLLHYLNRAILSPLRTPSRSKSHLVVVLCAISFNVVNGALMGSYLSSPSAAQHLALARAAPRTVLATRGPRRVLRALALPAAVRADAAAGPRAVRVDHERVQRAAQESRVAVRDHAHERRCLAPAR